MSRQIVYVDLLPASKVKSKSKVKPLHSLAKSKDGKFVATDEDIVIVTDLEKKYDPNEPRDEKGQWTTDPMSKLKSFWNQLPAEHRDGLEQCDIQMEVMDPKRADTEGLLGNYSSIKKTISLDVRARDVAHRSFTFFHEAGHAVDHVQGGLTGFWSNSDEFDTAITRDMRSSGFKMNKYATFLSHCYNSRSKHQREIFADIYAALHGQPVRGMWDHREFLMSFPRTSKMVRHNIFWNFDTGKAIKPGKATVEKSDSGLTTVLVKDGDKAVLITTGQQNGDFMDGHRNVGMDEEVGGRKVSDYPEGVHLILRKDAPNVADVHVPNAGGTTKDKKRKKQKGVSVAYTQTEKRAPRYVARNVVNSQELREWCVKNGIQVPNDQREFHVTVAYSRRPFAWQPVHKRLTMKPNASWHLSTLGGHIVLRLNHEVLNKRWQSLRNQGASWDYDSYKPHITLAAKDGRINLDKIDAPDFPIILGPEYSMVLKQYLPRKERDDMAAVLFSDILKAASEEESEKPDGKIDDDEGFDADDDVTGGEIEDTEDELTKGVFDVGLTFAISKVDDEKKTIYGFASVSAVNGVEVHDLQDDVIDIAEVTKAAHDFMTDSRVGGDMHSRFGTGVVVESMVIDKALKEVLKINHPAEGWFIGYRVTDDDTWSDVKAGKFTGFSIGGTGVRTVIE